VPHIRVNPNIDGPANVASIPLEEGNAYVNEQRADGLIELVLPADTRLVRVARLVASGVATTAGFDVDEVEDLRIAVDELCTALVEGGDGSPLLLGFDLGENEVSVVGSTKASSAAAFEPDRLALSRQILAVVVDDHDLNSDHGQISVRLRKRRSGNDAG
jgi:serine/threonine-protein kinase RsbW